jgi:hypothetical protein
MKNKLVATLMLTMLFASFLPIISVKASGGGVLGGIWYLDEGTGTSAYDSSGNGNHGTVYGGATWVNGQIHKALEFDSVNDYVEVPDSNSLDITGKITMEAWIYPRTVTKMQVIVQKYNHSGPPYNGAYYLGVGGYGYNNKILFGLSNDGYHYYYILSNTNITENTWTHIAATSNGTHMILYINGIKDKVGKYTPGIIYASAAPLRIGCYLPELGVARFFDGVIDEVRVAAGTIWTVDDDKVQCPTADFTSIQTAINAASNDDTILVHDGTYNEALYINKRLTIKGASTPIIQGSGSFTTNYGAREAVIFVEDAYAALESLDIEGQGLGPGKNYGIIYEESNGTIRNCIVSPNTINDMSGNAIGAWDGSYLRVELSTIENFGRIGVFYYDDCSGGVYNSVVEGQVYSDQGYVNYGIEIETYEYPCNIEIIGNEIYNCDNTHPSPSWSSAGIVIDGWLGYYYIPSSTVVISNNNIHDNYYGIEVVANPYSYAHYNNIYNNSEYGVIQDPDYNGNNVTFDARFNWWGDASGPTHSSNLSGSGDVISDNVDYSPWLGDTFETTPRTYHVNPTGAPGAVQEAIDEASSGDTIIVHEGTYLEALIINKALTVKGASTPIITGGQMRSTNYGNRQATIFVENACNVVLQDLDVEGQGLGVPAGTKNYAVLYENSSGTVQDCTVSPNTIGDMYSAAIAAWDNSDLTVKGCLIQNFGRIGIYSNNATMSIEWNTIIGQVYSQDNLVNYGIEIEDYSGPSVADIAHNVIYNCNNTNPSPLWSSAAIIVDTWREWADYYQLSLLPSKVTIIYNEIYDNFESIEIVANEFSYAYYNNFHDNVWGVWSAPENWTTNPTYYVFDARYNWWGDPTGPYHPTSWEYMGEPYGPHYGLGDYVSDYVLYHLWLPVVHDVAITDIVASPTTVVAGETVTIDVTVKNEGTDFESFTVTVYYDDTSISSQDITNLFPGHETTLTFHWDTAGIPQGDYAIKAVADTVPEEIDVEDNSLINGVVEVLWHDVAVIDVVSVRNWVYQGHSLNINVTVQNQGDFAENVTLTLYYNITSNKIIGTQIINLIPGESQTIVFTWDTKGVEYCHNYTLTAVASIAFPDNDPADNTFTDGKVKVRILGDANGDGIVDIADIYAVALGFGETPDRSRWDPNLDINNDGIIDIEDIYIVAINFGKICSP